MINPSNVITQINEIHEQVFENYEEFVSAGITLREAKDNVQWELGKLAYELTMPYKSQNDLYGRGLLHQYANDIGIHKKTLERYRRVYMTFSESYDNKIKGTPDSHLSFTHYERASRTAKPCEWIDEATDNEWTVAQMDREIKLSKGFIPEPSDIRQIKCPHCNHMIDIVE